MSKIHLLKQVRELFKDENIFVDVECSHFETIVENGSKICIECGLLLEENCLVVQGNFLKQRKQIECSLYNEIPNFISNKTKEKTVEIYKFVTGNTIYRTLRKAIILACLHRASIICNEPICFDDLLEITGLKASKASKGINYVSNNIPKNSEYNAPFFNDKMLLNSIMANLKLEEHAPFVENIIVSVKANSNIFNNSHYKSVVCGCIYFWLKINSFNVTVKHFASKVKVSMMTISKKYLMVKEVIYKCVMKKFLSSLLLNCKPRHGTKITSNMVDVLIEPREKYQVFNYDDWQKIVVKDSDNVELPLDDVSDIEEWNLLLNVKYYNEEGTEFGLNLFLKKNNRDLSFDFKKYDERNETSGANILKNIIIEKFTE